jgi:flagellar hook capping protein FlgD/IPT/TIG domain-containing protein/alginate lyase
MKWTKHPGRLGLPLAPFAGVAILLLGIAACPDAQSSAMVNDTPVAAAPSLLAPTAPAAAGIWISRAEIQALPMSGPAWNALKAQADQPPGTPLLSDQDQMNNVYVLAKALVHVRTGIESYRTEVRQNCMAAINTELGGRTLALGRELAAYVIAAELVGLEPAEDVTFRAWLRRCLTEVLDGNTLQSTHEDRPNNWGTCAGASRAAVAIYLGDAAELARTAQVFKGWLGDRSSYAGFSYGDLTWQFDPAQPVGINPRGATKNGESIDGALPEEMRRGCVFQFPPCASGYPWTALQGVTVQAEILHRAGYDAWNWQDQAIRRAFQFLYDLDRRYGGWWAVGNDECFPWLVNRAYGTSFPAVTPARPGKNIAWMDWTHGGPVTVNPAPAITSFAPSSGPVGTQVTVQGSRFTGTTAVAFNGVTASFTVDSDTRLRATVPASATTGRIGVTSVQGTGTSATSFVVLRPPTLAGFSPTTGPVGTRVTLTGAGFSGTTAVEFNSTAAQFTVLNDSVIEAQVPAAASSGPIRVSNPAGNVITAAIFTVTLPPPLPVITFFSPTSGVAGTVVDIHGRNLAAATATAFNGTAAAFSVQSDTLVRATVPPGAGTGRITVTTPLGTGTSVTNFVVIGSPVISSFAPSSGPVGTAVTITGTGFLGATAVTFNAVAATGFTVDSGTRIRATVPSGATTGRIRVTNGAGSGESGPVFTVSTSTSRRAFLPTDDAEVSSAKPTSNLGSKSTLGIRSTDPTRNSYLKFDVTGLAGSVLSAKVRVHSTQQGGGGGRIHLVSNNYRGTTIPWRETGLMWINAPIISGAPLNQQSGGSRSWVEFDVRSVVVGNGIYSFGLSSSLQDDGGYRSKEGSDPPELVIEVGPVTTPSAAAIARESEAEVAMQERSLDLGVEGGLGPREFALRPPYPNPFGARTNVRFDLPRPGEVRLTIYDLMGRAVRTLVDGSLPAGRYEASWDALDREGNAVASGVYLLRLEAQDFRATRKLLRVR